MKLEKQNPMSKRKIAELEYRSTITQGAESTHTYNGALFIIDRFDRGNGWIWQCMDSKMTVKAAGRTKEEVIEKAHDSWDQFLERSNGSTKPLKPKSDGDSN